MNLRQLRDTGAANLKILAQHTGSVQPRGAVRFKGSAVGATRTLYTEQGYCYAHGCRTPHGWEGGETCDKGNERHKVGFCRFTVCQSRMQ